MVGTGGRTPRIDPEWCVLCAEAGLQVREDEELLSKLLMKNSLDDRFATRVEVMSWK